MGRTKFYIKIWGRKPVGSTYPREQIFITEEIWADTPQSAKAKTTRLINSGKLVIPKDNVILDFIPGKQLNLKNHKWKQWETHKLATCTKGKSHFYTTRQATKRIGPKLTPHKQMTLYITLQWYRRTTPDEE